MCSESHQTCPKFARNVWSQFQLCSEPHRICFEQFRSFCGVLRSFYIMVQSSIKCVLSLTRHAPSL